MTYSHALHEPCRLGAAQETDAESIADLIIISGDTPPDFPKPARYNDGHPVDLAALLRARRAQTFAVKHSLVAKFRGRVAGVVLGYRVSKLAASGKLRALPNYLRPTMDVDQLSPESFYVNTLALYPDFQNLGLGCALLEAAEAKAALRRCRRLTLEVGAGNQGAIKFYIRHGFEQIALLPGEKNAPSPYDKDIVLLQRPVELFGLGGTASGGDGMADTSYDLAVIGAGPGGYVAAIRAAQLGLKSVVIEREHLGGICLNWGCIPTKALLRTSEIYRMMQHLDEFGLSAKEVSFDLPKIVARSRKVAAKLTSGVGFLLKKNKVTVIDGSAVLKGAGVIGVTGKDGKAALDIKAKHVIVATGARARTLPGLEADGKLIWTYKEAMLPPAMPKSLIVIGSGAIGIEFASFYSGLGAKVTVIEIMDRILPVEDEEISVLARKSFEKQGMVFHTGAKVEKLEKGADSVKATVSVGGTTKVIEADRAVLAIGITGNTENLGLEALGVKVERGHIVIDEWCRTSAPGIYAIGDVTGAPWLAHKASHEGVICVEKIAGVNDVHPLNVRNIPGCTYCTPQVASVGLTEAAAKAAGHEVRVGRFPYQGNGKAIALGEPEGLVKTVFDAKTGELLGAHMIGAEVTELIQGYGIAKTLETTEAELMHTIFPHPTLSEMMHEAVLDAYGRAIHF